VLKTKYKEMKNVKTRLSECSFEHLTEAYERFYSTVAVRKTKEVLEKLGEMEAKGYGKKRSLQNQRFLSVGSFKSRRFSSSKAGEG
jgi:hypothetical protein